MRKTLKALVGITSAAISLFAGALTLQIGNPAANPEAQRLNAAVVAQVVACNSPEKTTVSAEAIGMVDGKQQTIPLKVLALAKPGMYAVTHEWPQTGAWVVKFVATNPEYKNYATAALIPAKGNTVNWMQAKNYFHNPNSEEVASLLQ